MAKGTKKSGTAGTKSEKSERVELTPDSVMAELGKPIEAFMKRALEQGSPLKDRLQSQMEALTQIDETLLTPEIKRAIETAHIALGGAEVATENQVKLIIALGIVKAADILGIPLMIREAGKRRTARVDGGKVRPPKQGTNAWLFLKEVADRPLTLLALRGILGETVNWSAVGNALMRRGFVAKQGDSWVTTDAGKLAVKA